MSTRFSASTYALTDGLLWQRVALPDQVAPTCYCNLTGLWGLMEEDPIWENLRSPDNHVPQFVPGFQLGTASAVSGGILADNQSLPDGRGLRIPIFGQDGVVYTLQDSAIVAFESAPPSHEGWHSLVQTTPTGYSLPPLSTLTLVALHEAGSWTANGHVVQQRCYVVRCTYA